MLITATVVGAVFLLMFVIVRSNILSTIDKTLESEAARHVEELIITGTKVHFANHSEWKEREHQETPVNPVFVQLSSIKGTAIDRSPNLGKLHLIHDERYADMSPYTRYLGTGYVRQVRISVHSNSKIRAYLLAAVPLSGAHALINDFLFVLLIAYPIVVIGLFFVFRHLAGLSTKPIMDVWEQTKKIAKLNLKERVVLPSKHDEAHGLAISINELLQKVEESTMREKQFSSYVSHELRTPLSVLRGTLEVLIRKPRKQEEYEQKISECLREIDRLTDVMEQLMVLARADGSAIFSSEKRVPLMLIVEELVAAKELEAQIYGVSIRVNDQLDRVRFVPQKHVELILGNLIGNAIKYGAGGREVVVRIYAETEMVVCSVKDNGQGISAEDLPNIFKPFYRSESINRDYFSGTGLGLSIAQKAAIAIGAEIKVSSQLGKGAEFALLLNDYSKNADSNPLASKESVKL